MRACHFAKEWSAGQVLLDEPAAVRSNPRPNRHGDGDMLNIRDSNF